MATRESIEDALREVVEGVELVVGALRQAAKSSLERQEVETDLLRAAARIGRARERLEAEG